jgi:hypothetical protein
MDPQKDQSLARAFAVKCDQARADLMEHMRVRGLHAKDGWRIGESMRQADGGTVLVMRPIHMRHTSPPDLECSCSIDEPGEQVSAQCSPRLP